MLSPFFCARSSMPLGRLGRRWAPLGPMRSAASPPRSLSTATGRFPQCLSPPLGAPVRCSPLFIYVTFSTNMMACSPWVLSWLRVRGLVSPHLFLICSGGGGGANWSLSRLLRGSCNFPVAGCWACPSCYGTVALVHPFLFFLAIFLLILFVSFYLFVFACPSFNISVGFLCCGDT